MALLVVATAVSSIHGQETHLDARWAKVWDSAPKDARIRDAVRTIDQKRMKDTLFHLSKDPLPFRKLNYTLPGHSTNSLYEADDFLTRQLESFGYRVEREGVTVQAFRRDERKPLAHQYSAPKPDDPTFTAYNLYAERKGTSHADEIVLLVAHKDSQSWIDSPGANDNSIGTAGILEIARALREYPSQRTIRFLFCNEEHIPWTSVTAAEKSQARGDKLIAIFNIDAIGAKSADEQAAGKKTNVTAYTEAEGLPLAELMCEVNRRYEIGLQQRIVKRTSPGDDDGSFVKAGFRAAVINIGSWPYADPNYHTAGDIPELSDVDNAAMTIRATIAAVMTIDMAE